MNKKLTKQELIDKLEGEKSSVDLLPFDSAKEAEGYKNAFEIAISLAEQLSDKPQISEEDFDKLYQELITFMKGFAVFEDLRGILKKYLKPQPPKEPCKVKYTGYIANQGCTWQCDCGYLEIVDNDGDKSQMFNYPFCRNCGRKLSEVKDEN